MIPDFSSYHRSRVMILGATGFIGRAIWRRLNKAGAAVFAVGRDPNKLAVVQEGGLRGHTVVADVSKSESLRAAFEHVQPDIVINAAGYGVAPTERDEGLLRRVNAELPAELLELIRTEKHPNWHGQRFVHLGSGFEYGDVLGQVDEDTPEHPKNPYAQTKLEGTRAVVRGVENEKLRAAVVRVFTVYGPGEHPHRLLPSLQRAIATNAPLDLTAGEQERDFTFVDDVAEGILRLGLQSDVPPILNLATGRLTTVRAFAELALQLAGARRKIVNFGAIAYRPDELRQGAVSTRLVHQVLGWVPDTSVEQGIRATLAQTTSLSQRGDV